jgi:hypothetical protein
MDSNDHMNAFPQICSRIILMADTKDYAGQKETYAGYYEL